MGVIYTPDYILSITGTLKDVKWRIEVSAGYPPLGKKRLLKLYSLKAITLSTVTVG